MYVARFNDFDATGGPISKELIPKLTVVRKNLSSKLGVAIPDFNVSYVRQVAATIIFLKGVGGILFVFGSTFGSFLLAAAREYEALGHGPNATAASMMKGLPLVWICGVIYNLTS
ncbi:HR-like lesion-inducing protein [Trifolium medium]|uniref:HR-like lesion-inducing protein n=1 Tax=Trifolium medium TaxID=97028 RepID=A0A392MDF3_9FABA|nr:HR-like lesion-inducing protein [Trifolium medium]